MRKWLLATLAAIFMAAGMLAAPAASAQPLDTDTAKPVPSVTTQGGIYITCDTISDTPFRSGSYLHGRAAVYCNTTTHVYGYSQLQYYNYSKGAWVNYWSSPAYKYRTDSTQFWVDQQITCANAPLLPNRVWRVKSWAHFRTALFNWVNSDPDYSAHATITCV